MSELRDKLANSLAKRSRRDLERIAISLGVSGFSKLSKDDLVTRLNELAPEALRNHLFPTWWEKYNAHVYGIASLVGLLAAFYFYFIPLSPIESPPTRKVPILASGSQDQNVGKVEFDRVTALESDSATFSLDVILSNTTPNKVFVVEVSLIGFGSGNEICNPNPVATFSYHLGLKLRTPNVSGKVKDKSEDFGLPVRGRYSHSYCEGWFMSSYPQTIELPPNSKTSYVIHVDEIDLVLTEASSKFLRADQPIPGLGLTLDNVRAAEKAGLWSDPKDLEPKKFFAGIGPSYFCPLWKQWFICFHLSKIDSFVLARFPESRGRPLARYREPVMNAMNEINLPNGQAIINTLFPNSKVD